MATVLRPPIITNSWRKSPHASLALRLGTAALLLTTLLPAGRQRDWPNPQPPRIGRGVADAVYSHSDNLRIIDIPALQRWDSPKPVLRIVQRQDWVAKTPLNLIAAVDNNLPTRALRDWPNPRGAKPNQPLSWTDSFKLPLTTVKGTAQYNWPNPQGYRRNEQLGWFSSGLSLLTEGVITYPATITFDWPNPRGPQPLNRGFSDSFKLSLTTVKPPYTQYDWPVPRGSQPLNRGWTDSYKLPTTTLPFAQHEWRNPVRHRQNKLQRVWIQRPDLPLSIIFGTPATYTQYDWPVPRGPIPLNRGFTDSFKLSLTTVKGKFNYDWPNPRGAKGKVADWVFGTPIPLYTATVDRSLLTNRLRDWPNPLRPHSNPDFILRTPDALALTTPVQASIGVIEQQTFIEWRSIQTTGPNIVLKLTAPPVPPQPPVSHKPPKSHRGFADAGGGRTDVASGSSTADVTSGSSKSDAQDP